MLVSFSGNIAVPATAAVPDTATVLPFLGAAAGDAAPLLVYPPRITFAAAGQGSPLQGAANLITVTVAADIPLSAASAVTLSGALGTFSAFAPSPAATATWSSAARTLTVVPAQPLAAGDSAAL